MMDNDGELDLNDPKTQCIHKMMAIFGSVTFQNEKRKIDLKLKDDSKNIYEWVLNGLTLLDKEKYEEAIVAFDKALILDPTLILAWFWKGLSLTHLGRYEEGKNSFDRFLQESKLEIDTSDQVQTVILKSVGDDVVSFGGMAYWVTEEVKKGISNFYPGMEVNVIIKNIYGVPMVTQLNKPE